MANCNASRRVTLINKEGLHIRPAQEVVSLASRFRSQIELVHNGVVADARSIWDILSLTAEPGTQLILRARGEDAREALEAMAELFAKGFGDNGQQRQNESDSGTGGESQSPSGSNADQA